MQAPRSSSVTPLFRLVLEEVENLLEGAGVEEEGLAQRVVHAVTSRFGDEWTATGGVASDPDREFFSLPHSCSCQVRLVTAEMIPHAQLTAEEAYGCDEDDYGAASPYLPPPPSGSPCASPPVSLLLSPISPTPTFPPALPSMVGGGQGSQ
jgi:hypothetical protein